LLCAASRGCRAFIGYPRLHGVSRAWHFPPHMALLAVHGVARRAWGSALYEAAFASRGRRVALFTTSFLLGASTS
jgi:hypothetical protein